MIKSIYKLFETEVFNILMLKYEFLKMQQVFSTTKKPTY